MSVRGGHLPGHGPEVVYLANGHLFPGQRPKAKAKAVFYSWPTAEGKGKGRLLFLAGVL